MNLSRRCLDKSPGPITRCCWTSSTTWKSGSGMRNPPRHRAGRCAYSNTRSPPICLRQGSATTNFAATLPAPDSELAQEMLRDPYDLSFLPGAQIAKERDQRGRRPDPQAPSQRDGRHPALHRPQPPGRRIRPAGRRDADRRLHLHGRPHRPDQGAATRPRAAATKRRGAHHGAAADRRRARQRARSGPRRRGTSQRRLTLLAEAGQGLLPAAVRETGGVEPSSSADDPQFVITVIPRRKRR